MNEWDLICRTTNQNMVYISASYGYMIYSWNLINLIVDVDEKDY